ncbi:hypothetical protein H5S11_06375 [Limosilactobacillus sp. pH52_RY]|uniref:DUF771 domain-containing protein n=1 Tax=Limosilactobacillus reuteri TaxID=1598 RepID=A0A7X2G0J7_LIMRT|nr:MULTISPECIES: hypothetical protein [Limosilactobacillus]MBB1110080.1 hypothetical protein [Limosilactobacillus balticus]MRG89118.1 hypothetical protein [Limosilactobacillus reuteri]
MEATLDEQDYQVIADKVLQQIRKEYDLVPKGYQKQEFDKWVGIKEFAQSLPVIKDKEWVRSFILSLPAFKNWVINLNAGSGYPTRVNETQGLKWIEEHKSEINWHRALKDKGDE